jgi:hypothetical protein
MLTLLRWLAAALGVGLVAGETIRSWGVARPLYAVVDDFVMAILLFTAAAGGARRGGLAWLCGAYGFSAGMLYASFFLHLASRPDSGNLPQQLLTSLVGVAFDVSVIGFGLSLAFALRESG